MDQKKALVIGLGASGQAATLLLLKLGFEVVAFDDQSGSTPIQSFYEKLPQDKVTLLTNSSSFDENIDLTVVSPGIPQEHPLYVQSIARKIPLIGEAELALMQLTQRAIGITGTKGKTTLTVFMAKLLSEAHLKAQALGNIGKPLSEYALESQNIDETLVIELSSFQLETLHKRCFDIAVIMNISPDHMDRYPSFEAYAMTKWGIKENLKANGDLIVSEDTVKVLKPYVETLDAVVIGRSLHVEENQAYLKMKTEREYFEFLDACSKKGPNNECLLISLEVAKRLDIPHEAFVKTATTFKRLPHRIEYVTDIQDVHFYNDSKATNVESVIYAVNTLSEPTVLIVGGKDKGFEFDLWKETLSPKVKKVIVFGETSDKIYQTLKDNIDIEQAIDLNHAVRLAFNAAKAHENVLLSPGCSSFDMFKNYGHRGDCFKQIVLQMKEEISL